jgi:integrase
MEEVNMATARKVGKSYQIRVSCGYDRYGMHMEESLYWTPDENLSEKQVQKELERQKVLFEEAVKSGYKTCAMKFKDFAEEWLTDYAESNHRNTTRQGEKSRKTRIYEAFGHLRVDKITTYQIQKFINSLGREGENKVTGGKLKYKTIKHHLNFIRDVFSYAVRMKLLKDNPCDGVTITKGEPEEKQVYTKDEMVELLAKMAGEPLKYRTFFTLAAYSGFRRSELLGLEWKDIDFENNTISIVRTSNYTPETGTFTDTTKTKKSRRTLKFSEKLMGLLKAYKDEQDSEAFELGNLWVYSDRLFVKWNGEPMSNNTPYTWLKRFCERENLRFCDIHSFRHFATSAMIASGVDLLTVSRTLGHSQPSTTSNIYGHLIDDYEARVSEAVCSVLE